MLFPIFLFFFNDPTTPEIYTLSLHDALPIFRREGRAAAGAVNETHTKGRLEPLDAPLGDRKSTRLNSSHLGISYAVFCLKKKKIYVIIKYLMNQKIV